MRPDRRRWPLFFPLLTAVALWCAYPGGGGVWPLLFVGLVPLLLSLPFLSSRQTAIVGLVTGILHYLLLLYWIVIVLGKYGGLPVFVSVPAAVLLAGYMAVYVSCFAVLARFVLVGCEPLVALFAVPALWVGLDWLRGVLFTGFPWMDIGYALAGIPRLIQVADLFGHGGVSFFIVFMNCLVTVLLLYRAQAGKLVSLSLAACTVIAVLGWYSESRWRAVEEQLRSPDTDDVVMGIVQGNIDQSLKWSPEYQQKTVDTYIQRSQSLFGEMRPDLVVWPETALPLYLQTYRDAGVLQGLATQYDTALLTGAPWFEIVDKSSRDIRYYNSAQLLLPDGSYGGSYYKSHLVPFGEYVPMKKLLPFIAPLVEAVGDFSPGKVEAPLEWRGARVGVLICFESIFPDIAAKWVENGANVLVNLTNDAWYGKSSAPYHSMAMSVFRAVETRRSVVRSANTGISGFIDPLGRAEKHSPIFTTWSEARRVKLLTYQTDFTNWGFWFAPFCLGVGVLFSGIAWRVRKEALCCTGLRPIHNRSPQ